MITMNGIRASNVERMDELQSLMESNAHMKDSDQNQRLEEVLSKLSMYFNVLTDEDREYIQACRYAIEEQMDWSV